MRFASFIEKTITVEFFIYFIFLPIAIIPSILINHAGRYTLPYSCRRPSKSKSSKRTRGCHLARYYANLRNKSTVIHHDTTFKGDRRNSSTNSSKSTNTSVSAHRSFSAIDQVAILLAETPSLSLDLYLFESKLYWQSIPQPSPFATVFPSTEIDSFLHSFNVVEHFITIKSLLPSSHYKSIDPSSSQFQRILLEAKGLQTSIRQYGEVLPLSSPAIYVSTNKDDLPIVIDTGASCTITPTLSDFTSFPTKPDTDSLGSLTTVQTKVTGQGPIEWDIEDINGVLKKL
jgi:hypothetical protein